MKCFLVNPDYPKKHRLLLPVPPLGLAYVAAVMEASGCEVAAVDQFASGVSNDDLCRAILDFAPDIVGLGCLTPAIESARALVGLLREKGFAGKVLMGNVHPSLFAEDLIKSGACDMVARGEAEGTVKELLAALSTGAPLDSVAGLSFRDAGGRIVHNPDRAQLTGLDSLPFPAWHLFDLEAYKSAPLLQLYGLALPIQGSRGCPLRCEFCGQEIFYKKVVRRSVESLMAEIDYLADRFGIDYFVFVDANFPPGRRYGLRFCETFGKSRHAGKVRWCSELKVDMVDLELLTAMKRAGCTMVEFGFESGDAAVLTSLGKKTSPGKGAEAAALARKAGIGVLGLFMIGLPGEGTAEIMRTFRYAKRIGCDMAKFNIAIPQPGSRWFEKHRASLMENFRPETYSSWYRPKKGDPPLTTLPGSLPPKTLLRLQALGMLMFYARPGFAASMLRRRAISLTDMLKGGLFLLDELFSSMWPFATEKKAGLSRRPPK